MNLYYTPTCPFCMKVLSFLQENNITIELTDLTQQRELIPKLTEMGGKTQVPFLITNEEKGEGIYESDDIIAYIEEHHGNK